MIDNNVNYPKENHLFQLQSNTVIHIIVNQYWTKNNIIISQNSMYKCYSLKYFLNFSIMIDWATIQNVF